MHYAYKVHTEGEKARSSFVIKFRGVSNSRTHLSQPNLAPERRRAMARKDVAARRAMARFSAERGALLCIAVSEWRRPIKFATRWKGEAGRSPHRMLADWEWFAIMMQLVFPT